MNSIGALRYVRSHSDAAFLQNQNVASVDTETCMSLQLWPAMKSVTSRDAGKGIART